MKRLTDFIIAIAIFVIGTLVFSSLLMRSFAPAEAKLALYAEHMILHGWSWIGLAYQGLQGINFSTIPTLIFFSATQLGHLNVFAAVLPSAITSGVTLGFIYLLGALRNRSWGLVAVLLALGTEAFFLTSRSVSFAPYITAIVTLSIYCVLEFERQWFWLYFFQGCLFFLGFMIEGMVGLLLPAMAVWLYLIWRGQFKQCVYQIVWAIVIFIIGMVLLLFAASSQGGASLVHHVINGQLQTLIPKASWAWTSRDWFDLLFYAAALPLAIVTVVLRWHQIIWPKAAWEIQFLRFLMTWSLLMIVVTILWGWRPNFMLPMTPALALLGAYIFNQEHVGRITVLVRKILLLLFALVPIVVLLSVVIAFSMNYFKHNVQTPFYLHVIILLVLLSFFSVFFFLKRFETIHERSFAVIFFAALTFVVVNIGVVEQVNANYHKATISIDQFKKDLQQSPGDIVFYKLGPGAEDMLLMLNLNIKQQPMFVNKLPAIDEKANYLIMTQTEYHVLQQSLSKKYKVLYRGNIVGKAVVILRNEVKQAKRQP